MRVQLRPFYTPEELAQVYSATYDHTNWSDHIERVAKTVETLDKFAADTQSASVADLSAGDGAILAQSNHSWQYQIIGDYTSTGPIEETVKTIAPVDMFVCSETVEHLEDPDSVLRDIRDKAKRMVLTTPHRETNSYNPQHYWGWDHIGVREMLTGSGWIIDGLEMFTPQSNDYYTFQIWTCS